MRQDNFFAVSEVGYQFDPAEEFNMDMVIAISKGKIQEFGDVEFAEAGLNLLRNELIAFGTAGGNKLSDDEFRALLRAELFVARRLGLAFPSPPFRDFSSFGAYWRANGMSGSGGWEKRRQFIRELFQPFDEQLTEYINHIPANQLAVPVAHPANPTWKNIEDDLNHMRLRYSQAEAEADFNAVGLNCVRIVERVADLVFDANKHPVPAGTDVSYGKPFNRLYSVVEYELAGTDNADLRTMFRQVINVGQHVKHKQNPTKKETSYACDTTIALVSIIRSLTE